MRSSKEASIPFDLGKEVRILPSDWPHPRFKVKPGDFSKFFPYGNDYYGYQSPNREDLFRDGPSQDAHGGVIYFDGQMEKEDFQTLLRVMGVQWEYHSEVPILNYAVFVGESDQPVKDGYVRQIRIVSVHALRSYFKVLTSVQCENFPNQQHTINEVLWSFIEAERERWHHLHIPKLMDEWGDMGYQMLGFGLMQENANDGVCRIWSRPWILTK